MLAVTFAPAPPAQQLVLRLLETGLAYMIIYVVFRWGLRMTGEGRAKRQLMRRVE